MPITNFIKSFFKSEGHGIGQQSSKKKVTPKAVEKEMALEQLQAYLTNVQLRIEVLEYYQARYNDIEKNPWIPEYRMNQVHLRLHRLRSDADKLRARIAVLKLIDCKLY